MDTSSSPGLCASCEHARTVRGARTQFWLCRLADTDPRFPRYPRLPVTSCSGHRPGTPHPVRED